MSFLEVTLSNEKEIRFSQKERDMLTINFSLSQLGMRLRRRQNQIEDIIDRFETFCNELLIVAPHAKMEISRLITIALYSPDARQTIGMKYLSPSLLTLFQWRYTIEGSDFWKYIYISHAEYLHENRCAETISEFRKATPIIWGHAAGRALGLPAHKRNLITGFEVCCDQDPKKKYTGDGWEIVD